jgi:transcriptional regulator with GAF, ATPase, and Fis domain
MSKLDDTAVYHMLDGKLITDNCRLVAVEGPAAGAEFALVSKKPVRVGKGDDVDFQIPDPSVSRHHLTISVADSGFLVEDAGSKNGTFVGGMRVERAVLVPGAVLSIGASSLRILPAGETERVDPSPRTRFGDLVGQSAKLREAFSLLERVAPTDVTVLIRGETGTGKELAVRALHRYGARAGKPLVIFDSAGVAANLIESELFGHVKGAYTGATSDLAGVFERAHGGTVFIDEIGELPLELQPRLLRVLDSHTVRRLGDARDLPLDVRVVAATNRNLPRMVRKQEFRQDLFFRLSVVEVTMPPLRQRLDDLPLLIQHFLEQRGWDPGVEMEGNNLRVLRSYNWPGNVRELQNVIERAVSLAGAPVGKLDQLKIDVGHDGLETTAPSINYSLPFKEAKAAVVDRFEADYLSVLMTRCDNNLSHAAKDAQIDRAHLRNLLRRHGLIGSSEED